MSDTSPSVSVTDGIKRNVSQIYSSSSCASDVSQTSESDDNCVIPHDISGKKQPKYDLKNKKCSIKLMFTDLKSKDVKNSNPDSENICAENCLNPADKKDMENVGKNKISVTHSVTYRTNGNNAVVNDEHDVIGSNNSNSMLKMENMDDTNSESVSSSDNSKDPLALSVTKKKGRKKVVQPTENNINRTNEGVKKNSNPMSSSENSSTGDSRIIKLEPADDEILPMISDETNANETSGILQEKKRRGRPRKNPFDSYSQGEKFNKGSIDEGKKVLSKTESDEVRSLCSVSSSDKVPAKRGRGRPRKSNSDPLKTSTPHSFNERENNSKDSKSRTSYRIPRRQSILSERKRRIVKPKRFESFESFDFMDVNDRSSHLSNEASVGDNEEDFNGSDILQTDVRDDDEEDEEEDKKPKAHDGGGDARPKHVRKRRRIEVKPLALEQDGECEFDAFGKNVALQLKKLSLQDALELQIQILSLISQRRLCSIVKSKP